MSINRVQAAQDGRVMSQLPGYRNYPHNSIGNQFHTNVGQSGMGNWMGGGAMMVPRLPRSQVSRYIHVFASLTWIKF